MAKAHPKPERLGAFSDGVIAIIITIMVLELHVPHAPTWSALLALWPTLASYALSYTIVGLIWVNHHHLVHYVAEATGRLLWSNLLMLFFVSLIPFSTEWLAETRLAVVPAMVYGAVFVLTSLTFILFEHGVAAQLDRLDEPLMRTRRRANRRNWLGCGLYALSVPAALVSPELALGLIVGNALLYVVPEAWARGGKAGAEGAK